MRGTMVGAAAVLALLGGLVLSGTASAAPPDCNWGELTAEAILENDHDQGAHSSDPSGDSHGPDTLDEPRAGLANVVETGNLEATCEFIAEIDD